VIRTITATRYVTPLREGGSLPAIVEGDDDGTYVLKFRGAGQGPRALIAELVSGEIGRRLGLRVPEIVLIYLDPRMAKTEPDPEIQDLLRASEGLNLALDYLPGSITYDPVADANIDARLASAIVWFDALVTNVDRTPRNTNLLVWHRDLWLIDHGASLLSAQLGERHDRPGRRAVRRHPRARAPAACQRHHGSRRGTGPATDRRRARQHRAAHSGVVALRRRALRHTQRAPRRVPRLAAAAAGSAETMGGGGRACANAAHLTTPSSASFLASSAASSSTPA
jgi:hypothetical protein